MRILLFGAGGQLAHDLKIALAGKEVIGLTHAQADICDRAAVDKLVRKHRPALVVNTAAFHRVDDCEEEVQRSFMVNAVAVHHLALAANAIGATLAHFSTDYVFDGLQRRPYTEADAPSPQSIYALSKRAGERIAQRYAERYFLIRTCGLYGHKGASGKGGANFVETMLRLGRTGKPIRVVNDQVLTPTSTQDLAEKLALLFRTGRHGLYHMTNSGECSWYQFAREIFRLAGLEPDLQPTTSATFGARAHRPSYSVLDNKALREVGLPEFRPWQEALADYLRQRPD